MTYGRFPRGRGRVAAARKRVERVRRRVVHRVTTSETEADHNGMHVFIGEYGRMRMATNESDAKRKRWRKGEKQRFWII